MKPLYTAIATAEGGRTGHVRSSDGVLDLSLSMPKELGGPGGHGTTASVGWSLEMRQLPMRVAARVAYPLLRWGHDRVVEATVRAFRAQLVQGSPPCS